jgi:hypothetical protein
MSFLCLADNQSLNEEIAKVLLAYIEVSQSTYVSVMRDLTRTETYPVHVGEEPAAKKPRGLAGTYFDVLAPHKWENRLSKLWDAFTDLVTNLLLPMAEVNIVHTDIRPGWLQTYNILCRETDEGAELRLIDFDSISTYPLFRNRDGRCIFWYEDMSKSAYEYVWWQVLHVAYIWFNKLPNEDKESTLASDIFDDLFTTSKAEFQSFKNAFLGQWSTVHNLKQNHCKASVEHLLDIVSIVFKPTTS